MVKIKIGDTFEINTHKGKGYFQYVHSHRTIGELIRVLQGLHPERTDIDNIVRQKERYLIHFPAQTALNRKIIRLIGNYPLPDEFEIPKSFRDDSVDNNGKRLFWYIIDYETWKRQRVNRLTEEQKKLSEWGIWNDTLLIQRLEEDWSLGKWV